MLHDSIPASRASQRHCSAEQALNYATNNIPTVLFWNNEYNYTFLSGLKREHVPHEHIKVTVMIRIDINLRLYFIYR